jgi:hypothetical protein
MHGRFISRSIVSNGGGIDSGSPRQIRVSPFRRPDCQAGGGAQLCLSAVEKEEERLSVATNEEEE